MQLNSGSYTEKIKHLETWMEKPIMMGDQKQSLELHQYTLKNPSFRIIDWKTKSQGYTQ
jgi:hypothetical protein